MDKGLTKEQVTESRKKNGENIIKEKEPDSFLQKFKDSFSDPMIKLLLFISLILGMLAYMGYAEWGEIIGIVISVILVTTISTKTEMASDNEYRKLKSITQKDVCKVYRDGSAIEIIVDEVVVGDHIILQSGDKIPADGVLISGEISVDNSSLNGESEECKKTPVENYKRAQYYKVTATGDVFVDKSSLYRGAVTVSGFGIMLVQKVGMSTMMGAMAKDMSEDNVISPLKVKLADLANMISKFGYLGAIVIALALMIQNVIAAGGIDIYREIGTVSMLKDALEALMVAVAIIVMAVPEGLPLMIAIVLMQNTSKMLQNNVLVRKPIGIETAGSLNILFSDKTGTITKGELEVIEFFDGEANNSYKSSREIRKFTSYCIGKNTAAMFDDKGKVIGGNATDKALLNFLTKREFKKVSDIEVEKTQEFNSSNKYSAAKLKDITVYKGAPEVLLSKAKKYINIGGKVYDIDKDKINNKIDKLADKAMRVLALAYSESDLTCDTLPDDLIIVGFVAIRDDVREEAKQAINEVKNAGVQVVMITGDRKETAVAIAKDCGLLENEDDIALTSEELNNMKDGEVKEILSRLRVVSRALPTDKSRLVKLAQELNLVCGMTGDGVNDSPALKRADVGFAMGSGTDVAKEASDIVILDDNFKSIESAILYGRTIYNNILKFIKFQLTINVAAVTVSAIAPFIGIGQPLSITHILWINLIMDGLGALALGSEPALKKYMEEKPKERNESIISEPMKKQIIFAGAWTTLLSLVFLKLPFFALMFEDSSTHLTGYFTLFVLTAVFNGFNVRSEDINILNNINENKGFIKVMGIIVLVQIVLTFIGGDIFNVYPMTFENWIVIVFLAVLIIPVDMIRKYMLKKSIQS